MIDKHYVRHICFSYMIQIVLTVLILLFLMTSCTFLEKKLNLEEDFELKFEADLHLNPHKHHD